MKKSKRFFQAEFPEPGEPDLFSLPRPSRARGSCENGGFRFSKEGFASLSEPAVIHGLRVHGSARHGSSRRSSTTPDSASWSKPLARLNSKRTRGDATWPFPCNLALPRSGDVQRCGRAFYWRQPTSRSRLARRASHGQRAGVGRRVHAGVAPGPPVAPDPTGQRQCGRSEARGQRHQASPPPSVTSGPGPCWGACDVT